MNESYDFREAEIEFIRKQEAMYAEIDVIRISLNAAYDDMEKLSEIVDLDDNPARIKDLYD
jgi:hypothetical protein